MLAAFDAVASTARPWSRTARCIVTVAVLVCAAACGSAPQASSTASGAGSVFNVETACGAKGDGTTDDTRTIRTCIADAEHAGAGSTVYVPAGTFLVGTCQCPASLQIISGTPIVFRGAGAQQTTVIETDPRINLLSVKTDGTTVEGMTLDTQTHNALTTLITFGSNLSIHDDTFLGGTQTWDVMLAGPTGFGGGQPKPDANGNHIANVTVVNHNSDDGFVLEDQSNVSVTNMSLTGSRLSIFIDRGVTVDGYTFHPLPLKANVDGWEIFGPSSDITLKNVTTYGAGGVIQAKTHNIVSNVTIENEHLLGSGAMLRVGDVTGLTMNGCDFGTDNLLLIKPKSVATGLVIQQCRLSRVEFSEDPVAQVDAQFVDDTFLASSGSTFLTSAGGQPRVKITGGSFQNCRGGVPGTDQFTVSGVSGLPC